MKKNKRDSAKEGVNNEKIPIKNRCHAHKKSEKNVGVSSHICNFQVCKECGKAFNFNSAPASQHWRETF